VPHDREARTQERQQRPSSGFIKARKGHEQREEKQKKGRDRERIERFKRTERREDDDREERQRKREKTERKTGGKKTNNTGGTKQKWRGNFGQTLHLHHHLLPDQC
jgi:hypothetical protein